MQRDLLATGQIVAQHGLITRAQALALGFTRHQIQGRLNSGAWVAAERGVYRHHLHRPSWHNRLLACCLATGGVASHRSAAALWALDGCRPGPLEVTIPATVRIDRPAVRIHRTTQWGEIAMRTKEGIPATGVERTVLDLGSVVSPGRLRQAVDDARRRQLTDWPRLVQALTSQGRRGRSGTAALRALLDHYLAQGSVPRSDWSNLVADTLAAAGLPRPALEYPVIGDGFRAELDLAYPDRLLGLELDSLAWHFNHESFHADPIRRNRLTTLGWRILTFTWSEFVDHPERLVATVGAALRP